MTFEDPEEKVGRRSGMSEKEEGGLLRVWRHLLCRSGAHRGSEYCGPKELCSNDTVSIYTLRPISSSERARNVVTAQLSAGFPSRSETRLLLATGLSAQILEYASICPSIIIF